MAFKNKLHPQAYPSLRSWFSLLRPRIPGNTTAVGAYNIIVTQRELLRQHPNGKLSGMLKNENLCHYRFRSREEASRMIENILRYFTTGNDTTPGRGIYNPRCFNRIISD
jgi:hypothetical protein